MPEKELQPEVIVFAGPNGSGKSTITRMAKTVGIYMIIQRCPLESLRNERLFILGGRMNIGIMLLLLS